MNIYPWQYKQWDILSDLRKMKRLPHALLFSGMQDIGKKDCALVFAHALLCEKQDENGFACNTCKNCYLIQANSHPDLKIICPEEKSDIIKIDRIREAIHFVNESALQGGYQVIIIYPANMMNANAANALLKSLEEPSPNTVFILITDKNLSLLPTIKSRCQEIIFSEPAQEIAFNWLNNQLDTKKEDVNLLLKLANGSPLLAKKLSENDYVEERRKFCQGLTDLSLKNPDPLKFAAQYVEKDFDFLFPIMSGWLQDILKIKLSAEKFLFNIDFFDALRNISQRISYKNILRLWDEFSKSYQYAFAATHFNKQLLLEELFIHWVKYAAR